MRPQRLRRSVLACPGSNPHMMERAAASAADAVFLDLEDSCAPVEKPAARARVVEALLTHSWGSKLRAVRINNVRTPWAFRDVLEIVSGAGSVLDCVVLPKVRYPGDIGFLDLALGQLEAEGGLEPGRIGIEAQIEDPQGLLHAEAIARASPRLETLVFGPADFSAAMQLPSLTIGGRPAPPGDILHHALCTLAVAARAADLQVIDGPYLQIRDVAGFRRSADGAVALGYDGKWVVHPGQIDPCNQAFTPSQAQFDRAWRILEAYRHATEIDRRGAVMLGDEMIDEASRRMSEQYIVRGEAAGLRPSAADAAVKGDGTATAAEPTPGGVPA